MNYKLAVIGVGNMAKAVILGIQTSDVKVSEILLYDTNNAQYDDLSNGKIPYKPCSSVVEAVSLADCVLISVKPQNYSTVLNEISMAEDCARKLYITIGAGISVDTVSNALGAESVVRVLPNLPMTISYGVSVLCRNEGIEREKFDFVCSLFKCSGSILIIDESEMNRVIGVTSSSPAYVFKFIDAIYKGALAQGLSTEGLLDAICEVFIGAAALIKRSADTPENLIDRVASKGGTTESALAVMNNANIDEIIKEAMFACTQRADELGEIK